MTNYSFYGYLTASVIYLLLLPGLFFNRKNNPFTIPFAIAAIFSFIWAVLTAYSQQNSAFFTSDILPFETLRNGAWFFLLSTLLSRQRHNSNYTLIKSPLSYGVIFLMGFVFSIEVFTNFRYQIQEFIGQDPRLSAHAIFAIIGLILVEQVYRNATPEFRSIIKSLCLSLGALFVTDFIVYSKSLLFVKLDDTLWNSRGFIDALLIPLLFVSIRRFQPNALKINVSRKVVFHTTVLFSTGLYLILMSLAGFYIRDFGGDWGGIAQLLFIFLAILLLSMLCISGRFRAIAKVYVNKHFFQHRYDYRDEWIKLCKSIAALNSMSELSGFIIKTMAELVDSSGGGLWLKNEQGDFYLTEENNLGFQVLETINRKDSLITFLTQKRWVIDFAEFNSAPEIYQNVDLSLWHSKDQKVWLIIPLFRENEVEAFVVLTQAKVFRKLNWEDHDVLKTVGMQLANALALSKASEALAKSQQFEAYNRFSAYLVHDLKNLVAQISLIVRNAEVHKHNPEFIDDAIETLENVVHKIDGILGQLKKGNLKSEPKTTINLTQIIADVAIQQAGNKPMLQLVANNDAILTLGEKEKMTAVLGHLVQNAQDATADDGFVKLELSQNIQHAIIKISDNGCGMDNKFISERLFKPFDTTKGNAGMGIGVYEARDYIIKHSGDITVESMPGDGTTFTIKLPLFLENEN
jgi:putative PEP-CTERM system histidine kinase